MHYFAVAEWSLECEQPRHSQGLTDWVCVWGENISQKLGQITPFETLEMANFSTIRVFPYRIPLISLYMWNSNPRSCAATPDSLAMYYITIFSGLGYHIHTDR